MNDIRDGHYALGRTYLNDGKYDEAITHFQKVLEVDRNFIDSYHALALAYFEHVTYKRHKVLPSTNGSMSSIHRRRKSRSRKSYNSQQKMMRT